MTVNREDFKNGLKLWASGVAVVTTKSETFGIQGMTVTAFSSVSVDPPLILVCLNDSADTGDGIRESQNFAVNFLNAGQEAVSNQFAGGCSQQQRFENISWSEAASGAPVIDTCLASLDCKVSQQVRAGTHWIIIGEVQEVVCRSGEPLLYYSSAYRQLQPSE